MDHNRWVKRFLAGVARLPLLPRAMVVGAVSAGLVGAIVGLLVGLAAYPPTAAFAVFELGVPATVAGAVVGFLIGVIVLLVRLIRRRPAL